MTVNYIRNLKQTMNNSHETFENGYKQCSEEISKLIHSLPNIYPDQRQHLANRCRQIWTNHRLIHHHHQPYQKRIIEQNYLQIIINDSPKLWKPYI
jgi:hypothetical protein